MQESITSNLNKLAVARTAWNCAQRVYIYSSSQLRAGRRRLLWNSGWRKFAVRAADTCNLRSQLHSRCTPGRLTLVDGGISSITIHRLSAALVSSKPRKKTPCFSLWILNGRDRERNELFVLFFYFFSNVIVDTWTVRLNFGLIIHGRGLISSVILGISNVISYYKYYLQYNFIYGMQFSLIIDRTV